MATRSTIGVVQEGGTIRSIYCHWDGYPEGVGTMLKEHYTDLNKIETLLNIGDISSLREDIGDQHDFDSASDVTTFYGRDRGEDGVSALVHSNLEEWLGFRQGSWCEWGYLWRDGMWWTYKIKGEYV